VGGVDEEVTINGVVIPRFNKIKYLGSIIEKNGDSNEDINHRIKVGWKK